MTFSKALAGVFLALALLAVLPAFSQKKYEYKTVPGDPLQARIYTLDNGLTVYLSVYQDAPRIQVAVAVRTGSKNDPPDNTGSGLSMRETMGSYIRPFMFIRLKAYKCSCAV